MASPNAAKPAPAATGNGLQIDQLGGSISSKLNRPAHKKQRRPSRRRAAYLERQRRVAQRAEWRALAELDCRDPPATWRDYLFAGIRHGREFPDFVHRRWQKGER